MLFSRFSMGLIERFIFFPSRELLGTPSDVGLSYEDVWITATDGVGLHGWYVPGNRSETLLWFHGNAGNISDRLDNLRVLHDYLDVNVLLLDYRQYGRSEGKASERGLYADADAALAYLQKRSDVAPERILYLGQSLGSAVAVYLATSAAPLGLILECPFVSVREMARAILPIRLPLVVPAIFDNLARIGTVNCPTLIVHGDRDETIPYRQGQRVFEAANPPKYFHTVEGGGHNDIYVVGGEPYFCRVREFIDGLDGAQG